MNEYIVYTTDGYTSGANTNVKVENCQVLGVIDGLSGDDAIRKLFEQNEWIEKAGFTIGNTLARPLLTTSIKEEIKTVIDYLWKDEHARFQESNHPDDHIFHVLKRLKSYISRHTYHLR